MKFNILHNKLKIEIIVESIYMDLSLSSILVLLEHYKYLIIFPIAVFEGPIIIIISGFLVYLGFLNAYVAYLILATADVIGDYLHYALGKYGRHLPWFKKIAHLFSYDQNNSGFLESHFEKHAGKTLLLAKLSHGVGGAIQVAAGIAKVDFFEFLRFSIIGTLIKTLILLLLGYYVGSSYLKIDGYLDTIAFITISIVAFTLLYIMVRRLAKNFLAKND